MKMLKSITEKIGNTPLIKIEFELDGKKGLVFCKNESLNFSGSVKDRMASEIIKRGIEEKKINKNTIIVEATSGNTGLALSKIGRALGIEVVIFMPDYMTAERKELLKKAGATLKLISKEDGGLTGCVREAKKLSEEKNVFWANQFENYDNLNAHYLTTGPEIISQMIEFDEFGFLSGVGTGGTLCGTAKYLKEIKNKKIKVVAIEAKNSKLLSEGKSGAHKLQGFNGEFVPKIYDKTNIDEIISIDDMQALAISKKFYECYSFSVGFTASANIIGAMKMSLKCEMPFVTIIPDNAQKYLSVLMLDNKELDYSFFNKLEHLKIIEVDKS